MAMTLDTCIDVCKHVGNVLDDANGTKRHDWDDNIFGQDMLRALKLHRSILAAPLCAAWLRRRVLAKAAGAKPKWAMASRRARDAAASRQVGAASGHVGAASGHVNVFKPMAISKVRR